MADLTQLIGEIDALVAEAGDRRAMDYRAIHVAGEAIARRLTEEHGARARAQGDGYSLKLGGIRTSCTGGWFGLFSNWQNAARRRLAQMEAN